MQVISTGWPDNKKVVPLEVRAYFHCHDGIAIVRAKWFDF